MKSTTREMFLKLYDELSDAIFRHCYFRVSDREKAKDLTQETFIKVWGYIDKNSSEIKNLKAFVYKIASNLIIDDYRKKKAVSLDDLQETGFDPMGDNKSGIETQLEGKEMLELLNGLDDKYREAIVMRYIDNLTPKEIAEQIGESENNVSVRINRGIKMIKEKLKEADI